jgi:hypothetical protein
VKVASRRRRRGEAERPRRPRLAHFRADGAPKARFADRADAERAALQARLEHGADLGSYQCDMCGGWHLGNREGDTL